LHIALVLFMTFVLAVGPTSEWAAGDADAYRLSSVVIMMVGLVLSWRLLRRGVVLEPDELVIRNLLRFRSVPLDEVVAVAPPRRYGLSLHTGLQVRLLDGSKVYASAFTNTPIDSNEAGTPEAAEMTAFVENRRSGQTRAEPVVPDWQISGNVWAYRVWLLVPTFLLLALLMLLVATLIDPASVDS